MSDNNDKELYLNFDEYICQGEPSQREAAYAWSTAIGLTGCGWPEGIRLLARTCPKKYRG